MSKLNIEMIDHVYNHNGYDVVVRSGSANRNRALIRIESDGEWCLVAVGTTEECIAALEAEVKNCALTYIPF